MFNFTEVLHLLLENTYFGGRADALKAERCYLLWGIATKLLL